jgi:hypothetical protein
MVEDISDREPPPIYVSDLTEQKIRHEIREADDNLLKKGSSWISACKQKAAGPLAIV